MAPALDGFLQQEDKWGYSCCAASRFWDLSPCWARLGLQMPPKATNGGGMVGVWKSRGCPPPPPLPMQLEADNSKAAAIYSVRLLISPTNVECCVEGSKDSLRRGEFLIYFDIARVDDGVLLIGIEQIAAHVSLSI